jgi:hypothetical protein
MYLVLGAGNPLKVLDAIILLVAILVVGLITNWAFS